MDELVDRVGRVLTEHRYLYAKKSMGGGDRLSRDYASSGGIREEFCTCGWSTGPRFAAWVNFARHQADAVDTALGLREESGVTYRVIGRPGSPTPGEPSPINAPHFRRYVTEWEEA